MESISRELALKPWIYYISHTHRYSPSSKALSPGVWHARGKHPQPHCYPTVGLWTADIWTGRRVRCRTIRRRKNPQLSHWSSGGVFPTITHIGRVSLYILIMLMRGVSSSHRTRLNIGWPVQTGRTIHFTNESHKYPSPDIITNPSTGQIHHYLYNIVHICGNIKKQLQFP